MIIALIFLYLFLAITFGYSAYEKAIDFDNSVGYYRQYLASSFTSKYMRSILIVIILSEILITLFLAYGLVEILLGESSFIGFLGLIFSAVLLILFLIGQRIAKDYDGARGTAIYMILCVLAMTLSEIIFGLTAHFLY